MNACALLNNRVTEIFNSVVFLAVLKPLLEESFVFFLKLDRFLHEDFEGLTIVNTNVVFLSGDNSFKDTDLALNDVNVLDEFLVAVTQVLIHVASSKDLEPLGYLHFEGWHLGEDILQLALVQKLCFGSIIELEEVVRIFISY